MMTDAAIDFDLAVAIGYADDRLRAIWPDGRGRLVQVWNDGNRGDGPYAFAGWQRFDHKDPAVIWPIAELFNAFPRPSYLNGVKWYAYCSPDGYSKHHNNPATATALAVIEHCKKGPP